jgi:hypothetical protein
LDTYSFRATKGELLRFEAVEGRRWIIEAPVSQFAPELSLYRSERSWFDAQRPRRVLFERERSSDLMPLDSGGTYRFEDNGEYFLQVSGLFGQGCSDCTYQVRVWRAVETGSPSLDALQPAWSERSLSRSLAGSWVERLKARAVQGEGASRPAAVTAAGATQSESLPLKTPDQIQAKDKGSKPGSKSESVSVPALFEGSIDTPGKIDYFTFHVERGQKLAFELETPNTKPPYFNPRFGIADSDDHEVLSNVERRLSMFNNNADPQVYLKAGQAKAIYSFERGGEYRLLVRDLTSRYGDPSYRYRIMVRPQIPHIGEISVVSQDAPEGNPEVVKPMEVNRLNLVRGQPKRLVVVASYEEGFDGELSLFFTGMPEGVQVYPAVRYSEGRGPLEVTQNADIVSPKLQKGAMMVLALPATPRSVEPQMVTLHCQAISNGRVGPDLIVRQLPVMIVDGPVTKGDEKSPTEK